LSIHETLKAGINDQEQKFVFEDAATHCHCPPNSPRHKW